MEFRILGPLEARSEGRLLPPGGRRQCALLAYLLLHANEVVSAGRLVEELWFGPPLHAVAAVHTQISRLRKVVGERLVTSGQAYSLRVEPDELDLLRARALLADAGGASSPEERSRLLREVEALWQGEPLAGLDAPFVSGEAAALEELRYGALEERFAADLERGCAGELLAELSLIVAQQPQRERLRMQQILALYRAGRQVDALEAYRDARSTLAEELGLEPSPALRELERAVLRQDPALDLAVKPPAEAPQPAPTRRRSRRRSVLVGSLLGLIVVSGVGAAVLIARTSHDTAAPQTPARVLPKTVVQKQVRRVVAPRSGAHASSHQSQNAVARTHGAVRSHTPVSAGKSTSKPAVAALSHGHAPPPQQTVATTTPTQTAPTPRRAATISDTFAGAQIDPTIWYQSGSGNGWTVSQHDGRVEYAFDADATPGGPYDAIGGQLGSKCRFPGDFDARVDFALPQWPSRNGVIVNLWAVFPNVGYAAWRWSHPQFGEEFGSYTGPGGSGSVQLDDVSGSLRIARSDGLLSTYFLHNGSWDELTSTHDTRPATIAIGASAAGNEFGGQPVTVDFRNFTVTGDNLSCPPGSQPTGG
jgi:DNA-binding SARP family transcriptional activator